MKSYMIIPLFAFLFTLIQCEIARNIDVMIDKPGVVVSDKILSPDSQAVVTIVSVTGESQSYTFSVTLQSPDTGCEQYADWWEVIKSSDSSLVYRRILAHSHVSEQPFRRSGGPVAVDAQEQVIIRGHMNNLGYGSLVMRGSAESGFIPDTISIHLGSKLEEQEPLPGTCAF